MKTANINLKPLTIEQMLNHEDKKYNPETWEKSVKRMIAHNAEFYIAEKNDLYSYNRFYVTYRIPEGLFIFNEFSSGSLTNRGFTMVYIVDGQVYTKGFGENSDCRIVNNKEGRKFLAENICSNGVLISSAI